MRQFRSSLSAVAAGVALSLVVIPAWAVSFTQTNLVTDDPATHPAQITDPDMVNPWGMSFAAKGPFWVSANGSGLSTLYKVDPVTQATAKQALSVSIPGDGAVTGQAFNGNAASFNGNLFMFVSEDGTVSGWRPALGTSAETITVATAVYTGASIGSVAGSDYLYAANFKTGAVDVYKGTAGAPSLAGSFTDSTLPSGYAPFNVQVLNGALYVAYAQHDADNDEIRGAGLGYVDKFALDGTHMERVASGDTLNAPWGMAIAPSSFGPMAGDLLVGNFGDGHINIYDPATHAYLGQVLDASNQALAIHGLWAISPGNDGSAGSSHMLYFTAGPNDETHGLFGVLTPVPEPETYAMMLAGLGLLGAMARRRKSSSN